MPYILEKNDETFQDVTRGVELNNRLNDLIKQRAGYIVKEIGERPEEPKDIPYTYEVPVYYHGGSSGSHWPTDQTDKKQGTRPPSEDEMKAYHDSLTQYKNELTQLEQSEAISSIDANIIKLKQEIDALRLPANFTKAFMVQPFAEVKTAVIQTFIGKMDADGKPVLGLLDKASDKKQEMEALFALLKIKAATNYAEFYNALAQVYKETRKFTASLGVSSTAVNSQVAELAKDYLGCSQLPTKVRNRNPKFDGQKGNFFNLLLQNKSNAFQLINPITEEKAAEDLQAKPIATREYLTWLRDRITREHNTKEDKTQQHILNFVSATLSEVLGLTDEQMMSTTNPKFPQKILLPLRNTQVTAADIVGKKNEITAFINRPKNSGYAKGDTFSATGLLVEAALNALDDEIRERRIVQVAAQEEVVEPGVLVQQAPHPKGVQVLIDEHMQNIQNKNSVDSPTLMAKKMGVKEGKPLNFEDEEKQDLPKTNLEQTGQANSSQSKQDPEGNSQTPGP
jgi:hypothetical protein